MSSLEILEEQLKAVAFNYHTEQTSEVSDEQKTANARFVHRVLTVDVPALMEDYRKLKKVLDTLYEIYLK